VDVRAGLGLGEGERSQLATAGEVRQEALLLLVVAEQDDALHADRLVHPQDHRERGVDLCERLGNAAIARLGQSLAAVLLGHVQAHQPPLAELTDRVVADPALLFDLVGVVGHLPQCRDQRANPPLFLGVGLGIGEDELLVDLAEEE
jgi:hypothetical protein